VPTLALPREEIDAFVAAMWDRFRNPFIRHEVRSILLNGSAKFPARIGQVVGERDAAGERSPMLALGVASWLVLGSGQLPDSDAVRSALEGLWSRFEAGSLTAGQLAVEAMDDAIIWGEGTSWPEPFVADVAAAVESLLVDGPRPLLGA